MSYERDKIIGLIYRIFQAEEFKWYNKGIPTYEDIEKEVERLEDELISKKITSIETGRIRVDYDSKSQTYNYYLSLGWD